MTLGHYYNRIVVDFFVNLQFAYQRKLGKKQTWIIDDLFKLMEETRKSRYNEVEKQTKIQQKIERNMD